MKTPKLLLLLLSIVLIYVFDTTFNRGLKVRLFFARHNGNITHGTRVLELGFGYGMLGYRVIEKMDWHKQQFRSGTLCQE